MIERKNDAKDIVWPNAIALWCVIVCPTGVDNSEAVETVSEKLYADLIGILRRVVVGDKGLGAQQFEYKHCAAAAAEMIPATLEAVLAKLA